MLCSNAHLEEVWRVAGETRRFCANVARMLQVAAGAQVAVPGGGELGQEK